MIHTINTHKMKNLTQNEESQLEALLAKKAEAEKLEEMVQKAVDHINYETERLDSEIEEAKKDAESQKKVFETLIAIDKNMFKLTSKKKQLERKLFEAHYDYETKTDKKEFTPEQEKAAFAYLEKLSIPTLFAEVDVYKIEVPSLDTYVDSQRQTRSSGRFHYSSTGKTEMRLGSADYNERWCTVPQTLANKVTKELEDRQRRAAIQKEARSEKDQAIAALKLEFPGAKVEADQVWKRDTWSKRGEGSYEQIIKVLVGDLELEFSYGTDYETKKVSYSIKNHNFNLMAAVTASTKDLQGAVAMLQELKSNLNKTDK